MDANNFDALVRKLTRQISRRAAVSGSVGASLLSAAGLVDEALGKSKHKHEPAGKKHDGHGDKKHGGHSGNDHKGSPGHGGNGKKKDHQHRSGASKQGGKHVNAESCIPDGTTCPKKIRKHGKVVRKQSCDRCCHHFTLQVGGKTKCACKPNGTSCLNNGVPTPTDCCSGQCGPGNLCGFAS